MSNEIWVVAQMREDGMASVTFEVITAAKRLASRSGGTVAGVVIGQASESRAADFHSRGVARVYTGETASPHFQDDTTAATLAAAMGAHQPMAVLAAATVYGKALMARTAAVSDHSLLPDVTAFLDEGETIAAVRPCFGGNVQRTVSASGSGTVLITIRPKVFPAEPSTSGAGETVAIEVVASERTEVLESVTTSGQTVNLSEADIVVSGGRGLREAENFKLVFDLAAAIGGAVGASRAVVDAGWIEYAHQVGQTGKTVNPKLYIAVGISGAIQHLVGMQSSGVIVAINKDPDAPIFKISTFGIVGDLFEFLPAITRVFGERLSA